MKIIYLIFFVLLASCSTWNNLMEKDPQVSSSEPKELGPRFSETNQMPSGIDRNYKRMTRSKMEEESELQSGAGSLWVMEGQQSYLFAQNKTRKEGDIVNIKIEGAAMKQVETKVSVIRKLLKELEEEEKKAQQAPTLADGTTGVDRGPASASGAPGGSASASSLPVGAGKPTAAEAPAKEEKQDLSDIQTVQSRIIEKQPDGNYKIKGMQPFMIGQKEYKVIVTGLVRPEDFNDEGMSSAKLLDPQFDVVSVRRKSKDDKTHVF